MRSAVRSALDFFGEGFMWMGLIWMGSPCGTSATAAEITGYARREGGRGPATRSWPEPGSDAGSDAGTEPPDESEHHQPLSAVPLSSAERAAWAQLLERLR